MVQMFWTNPGSSSCKDFDDWKFCPCHSLWLYLLTPHRFILSLSSCAKCMVIDDQLNILPISSHVTAITPVPPKTKVSLPFLIGWLTCHSHMLATTVVMAHIYTYTHMEYPYTNKCLIYEFHYTVWAVWMDYIMVRFDNCIGVGLVLSKDCWKFGSPLFLPPYVPLPSSCASVLVHAFCE